MRWDVLVVGAGGAGLAAALEAAAMGARVLVLEKGATPGGSTGLAIGSIAAACTRRQRAAGIADSLEAHLEDALRFAEAGGVDPGAIADNLLRFAALVRGAGAAVDWLEDLGVRFSGPHPEPPHRVYRMHNVVPHTRAMVEVLVQAAVARGVALRTATAAEELLRSGEQVRGVRCRDLATGATHDLEAGAVVLAAGDSSASPGEGPDPWPPGLNPGAQGDGVRMAAAVGALAYRPIALPQLRAVTPPHFEPSHRLLAAGAILVNARGARFASELGHPAAALARQEPPLCYVVFDAAVAAQIARPADDSAPARDGWLRTGRIYVGTYPAVAFAYLDDLRAAGRLAEAPDLEGLARLLQIPASTFAEEVARYNRDAASGEDRRFGRRPAGPGVRVAPYFALGPFRAATTLTDGGLAVDPQWQVLARTGRPIPGLFAAGANAWGSCLLCGHGHHLAWSFVSGREAGRAAARQALARAR